jgi:DNA-binding PadR family transcriptional regulator
VFRYLVLGLLRNGASLHGYALMKSYRERTGVQLSTGSFYRELQRLVAEGLVETAANPSDADPRRAPYAITEAGEVAFDAWLTGPTGAAIGRYEDELFSKVLFLGVVDPTVVTKLVDGWKEELWLRSKMHERSCATLMPQSTRRPTATPASRSERVRWRCAVAHRPRARSDDAPEHPRRCRPYEGLRAPRVQHPSTASRGI